MSKLWWMSRLTYLLQRLDLYIESIDVILPAQRHRAVMPPWRHSYRVFFVSKRMEPFVNFRTAHVVLQAHLRVDSRTFVLILLVLCLTYPVA